MAKISGAAMTVINNRIYGGYSLLLDVDYDAMVQSLNPNRKKIESKGIKSVRARVGNIRDSLALSIKTSPFKRSKTLLLNKLWASMTFQMPNAIH